MGCDKEHRYCGMVAGKDRSSLESLHSLIIILQNNTTLYPTLTCITLSVLPSQASSVPCEQLFLGSKQIAIGRRACLGSTVFEQLVIMGSVWRPDLYDMAAWTAHQQEEVEPFLDYMEMLDEDDANLAWEKELDLDL